jgi:hypothetical protein
MEEKPDMQIELTVSIARKIVEKGSKLQELVPFSPLHLSSTSRIGKTKLFSPMVHGAAQI